MELIDQVRAGNVNGVMPFIDNLMQFAPDEAIAQLVQVNDQIDPNTTDENERHLQHLIESVYYLFAAILTISQQADFAKSYELIQNANAGFKELQLDDYLGLGTGMETYFSAVIDLRSLNIESGLAKINEAKAIFENLDNFGGYFAELIDSLGMEALYISGMQSMMKLELEEGKIAIGKAASAAESIAKKYYEVDSMDQIYFLGLSNFYKSNSDIIIQTNNLNYFRFDYFNLLDKIEASTYATKAIIHFSNALEKGEIVKLYLNISKGIEIISQVVFYLGQSMHFILTSEPQSIKIGVKPSLKKLKNAEKFFIDAGETGEVYVRICGMMQIQLTNLDRFMNRFKVSYKEEKPKSLNIEKRIQKLVSKGQIDEALEFLFTSTKDHKSFDQVILLKSRHSILERDRHANMIDDDNYGVELTNITKSLLELVKSINDN